MIYEIGAFDKSESSLDGAVNHNSFLPKGNWEVLIFQHASNDRFMSYSQGATASNKPKLRHFTQEADG